MSHDPARKSVLEAIPTLIVPDGLEWWEAEELNDDSFQCDCCGEYILLKIEDRPDFITVGEMETPLCWWCWAAISTFRKAVLDAVEGTPYDPQEDIDAPADLRKLGEAGLIESCFVIIEELMDAFGIHYNIHTLDFEPPSPMVTLCSDLQDALEGVVE